jgi:hypothetical protein
VFMNAEAFALKLIHNLRRRATLDLEGYFCYPQQSDILRRAFRTLGTCFGIIFGTCFSMFVVPLSYVRRSGEDMYDLRFTRRGISSQRTSVASYSYCCS